MLEKKRLYREAADALHVLLEGRCCPDRRGDWWIRLSTDLEHTGDVEGALQVCAGGDGRGGVAWRGHLRPIRRTPSPAP